MQLWTRFWNKIAMADIKNSEIAYYIEENM